ARRVFNQSSGKHSLFECCRVNEREHRGPGWPFGLQRAIVLIVLKIAATYEDENSTGFVVEPYDRALQIFRSGLRGCRPARFRLAKARRVFGVSLMIVTWMLLGFIEIPAKRFFRDFLQFAVDRRVNAKAFVHGAVPSNRVDHLLSDIINRVVLALRVLTISNHEFLRLRGGVFGTVDETEIVHARQW